MVRATDGNTCWKEFTTGLKLYICVLKNVLSLSASLEYSLGLTFCSFFPRYWQVVSKLMYEVENHYFLCRMLLAAVTLFLLVLRTELEQCVSVCESKRQRSLSRKSRQSGLNHSLFFSPPPRSLWWVLTMPPFLRITLSNYDVGALSPLSDAPICAIRIKESIDTGMYSCTCLCKKCNSWQRDLTTSVWLSLSAALKSPQGNWFLTNIFEL